MANKYSTDKKIKYTSISIAQLIGLAAILSIASCQERCSPKLPEASMAMEIENSTLRGSDRTIRAYIKNNGEVSTSLASFHLRASVTETGGVGSTLAYTDAGGNANKKEKIDEPLTHFTTEESLDHEELVTIALQVEPGTGVSQAAITLELYDKNKEETVATETVEWSATSYKLSFTGIPDPAELKDNDELQIQIKNEGVEVNTDDIFLYLNSTEGVEFGLNKHKGKSIKASLKDILGGSTSTLAKGTSTNNIPLKLEDAKGKYSSTITLELKQADKSLDERTVKWSATLYKLSFTGIPDPAELKDNNELQLQIKNEGDEVVNTDDIFLCLNSTKGVEFGLNEHKGKSIEASLKDILGGSTSTLAKGTSTNNIPLKLEDAKGKYSSTITLELKQADKSLDKRTVKWLNEDLQLSIGKEDTTFTCTVTSKTNQEFDFSKIDVSAWSIKRSHKDVKKPNTKNKKKDKKFIITLDPKGNKSATLKIQLKYDGENVGKPQEVVWKNSNT